MSTQSVILNKKLEKLRKQYQSNVRSMDDMRADYETAVKKRLEALDHDMQQKLSDHDKNLRTEYEKEFTEYSERINAELDSKIEEINSEYLKLKNENDDMRIEMKRIESEMSEELHRISGKLENREQLMKNEAQQRMEKAYDDFHRFSVSYPHEFFEPNAADALLMQMESVKVDFRSGFYEACMASSSNIKFQIDMLEDRMKKNLEQWLRYFNRLEMYTVRVSEFLYSDEFAVIKSKNFEKRLTERSDREADTFDFWSYGEYKNAVFETEKYNEFINMVSVSAGSTKNEKVSSFLKSERKKGNNITFEELSAKIDEITELHKKVCSMRSYIHSGFTASYERAAELSGKIINILSGERCGDIVKKGFKDNDIRNEYTIISNEPGKRITVCIFPVSPDKITVVNSIGIYIEHTGSGTAENLKATEETIISAIKSVSDETFLIAESNCHSDFSDMGRVIDSMKIKAAEKRKKELSMKRTVR